MPEIKPFKPNWIFQKQMKLFKEVHDAVLSLQVHRLQTNSQKLIWGYISLVPKTESVEHKMTDDTSM